MRRNKKLWAYALAGALAVSNLSAVAMPITAFAAVPTPSASIAGTTSIKDEAGAGNDAFSVTLGEQAESVVYVEYTYADNNAAKEAIAADTTTALEYGDITKSSTNQINSDAVTYSIGKGTLKTAAGNIVIWPVTVNVDATGSQKAGADVVLGFPTWNSSAVASSDYTISFTDQKAISPTSNNLALRETTDTTNLKKVTSQTVGIGAPVSPTLTAGLLVGSKVLNFTGTVATAKTALSAGNAEWYWELVSSDDKVLTASTTAAGVVSVTTLKPGSADLTVNLHYHNNPSSGTESDEIVGTTTVNYVVKAQPTGVTIIKDNAKLGAKEVITLDDKTSEVTLEAEVAASGFTISQDVTWFQKEAENEKFVKLAQSGNKATLTAAGSTKNNAEIYAISNEDLAFWNAYNNSTASTEDAKIAAGIAATSVEQSVLVRVVGQALTMTTDPESVNILKGDDNNKTVDIVLNDANFTVATVPTTSAIVYTFKSSNEKVAKYDYTAGSSSFEIVPVDAGEATITVTGTYKITEASGGEKQATVTSTVNVKIVDPDAVEKALEEAETAKETAEAEAAAQKEAATKATAEKETAQAEKETAQKEAAAQKTAADAAKADAAAQKKAADAAKADAATQKAAADAATQKAAELQKKVDAQYVTAKKVKATNGYVVNTFANGEATLVSIPAAKTKATMTLASKVTVNGKNYKVTKIAAKALKTNTKIKTLTVPATVKQIGANAFGSKVTKLTVKGSNVQVLNNALKSINKKAKVVAKNAYTLAELKTNGKAAKTVKFSKK